MWSKAYLNNENEVMWRVCDDVFEVKCTVDAKYNVQGCRLNILSCTSAKNGRMCLGSFSEKNGVFVIHKTYTLPYLTLQNISFAQNPDFEITDYSGNVICSTKENSFESIDTAVENEDFAMTRARNLLESVKVGTSGFDVAEKTAYNVASLMNGYERVALPCFDAFEWVKITSMNEDFELSSVAHIIYEADFLRTFQMYREWFFGNFDERLFAVCIRSECENTPFANASDCSRAETDSSGGYYHAVGIALLDDGQYFYRI